MVEVLKDYEDPKTGELKLPEVFRDLAIVKHHTMFTKVKQNKLPGARLLRTMTKVPMLLPDEKELHANVEPPIVPSKLLAVSAIRFLEEAAIKDPLERFDAFRGHMWHLASADSSRVGDEAFALASNLDMQRQFMDRDHYLGEVALLGGNHEECA